MHLAQTCDNAQEFAQLAPAELGVGRSTPRMLLRSFRHTREARKQRGWRKPITSMEGGLGSRLAG